MRTLCILIVLPLAAVVQACALAPAKAFSQYALSSWGHGNGLAANSVMAIAQTSDGFLWLATEQGLVRWDGLTMTTFDEQNAPALGDRFIRSLAADPDGDLWIGTMSGIARYHAGQFQDYRKPTEARTDVYDICADGSGGVWFSSDLGLHHYGHGRHRVYTVADGLPSNGITSLVRAQDGTLWLGTIRGLASFSEGRFSVYTAWAPLRRSAINAIAPGSDGSIWVGLADGTVGRWTRSSAGGELETWWSGPGTRGRPVEALREDSDGTLWIAFKHAGLARLRDHQLELLARSDGLPSDDPDWIFEDREHSLWVGWADAGLSMLRDTKFTTFGKAEGLSSDHVLSVTGAPDGGLWVGTSDAGVDHLKDGRVEPVHSDRALGSRSVLGLLARSDGSLWIGSDDGLVTTIRRGHAAVTRVMPSLEPGIPAMVEDRQNRVWVAADAQYGLRVWQDGKLTQAAIPGRPVSLAAAPDGSLWIGSYQTGLIEWKDGVTRVYDRKSGLASLALTSVFVDADGVTWAGTELAGLVRVKDGKVTCYTSRQGLFDDAIGAILEDNRGFLWMGGSRGIWRIAKQELNDYAAGRVAEVHSEAYGYADGLRSVQTSFTARPAAWKSADGRLWFATAGGLSMIDPAHILENPAPPVVTISSVAFNGPHANHAQLSEALRSDGFGNLEISFAVPGFLAPAATQVRYRLDGAEWARAGTRRTVNLWHVRPGSHTFEVEAANGDGAWSTAPAVAHFTMVTSFYQTDWFPVLIALAVAAATWSLYVARVHFFKGRAQSLEEIVSRRTAELRVALAAAETARELLREQASRDSLTGLWNRRAIFEILEAELALCRQASRPFCVVMVDADCFKALNDTWGHLAGDCVIQEVSQRLRRGLRTREAVGRYGGEELLILLPDCSLQTSLERAEQLRSAMDATPILFNGQPIWVTCSFGVAQAEPDAPTTAILAAADQALYAAKRAGRNCVRDGSLVQAHAPVGIEVATSVATLDKVGQRPASPATLAQAASSR